jgi:hypothetical protein
MALLLGTIFASVSAGVGWYWFVRQSHQDTKKIVNTDEIVIDSSPNSYIVVTAKDIIQFTQKMRPVIKELSERQVPPIDVSPPVEIPLPPPPPPVWVPSSIIIPSRSDKVVKKVVTHDDVKNELLIRVSQGSFLKHSETIKRPLPIHPLHMEMMSRAKRMTSSIEN